MEEFEKKHAKDLLDLGELDKLYEYINAPLKCEDPYALYIFSCFSLNEFNETHEEFNERRIKS